MSIADRLIRAGILAAAAALVPLAASADEKATTVTVSLSDSGGSAMDMMMDAPDMGMGMGGDMAGATMFITMNQSTIPAGEVTFEVTNDSDDFEHEMIVAPLADASAPLPYDADEMAVDEDAAAAIGEVPELEPHGKGSATFHLQPGSYILFCNVPGHYRMGMWTLLTVTG